MNDINFYLKTFLKYIYLSELEKGFATINDVCSMVNLNHKACKKFFNELIKLKLIKEIKNEKESKYKLTITGRKKIKVVITGGVFDVLHIGHLAALKEAKSLGDVLIAIVASDTTVKKMKGKNPVFPEYQRRILIEGLKPVDKALIGFEEINLKQTIKELKPDIIAIGYDQNSIELSVKEALKELKLPVKVVKLKKYNVEELDSSTKVKMKVIKQGA